MDMDTVELMVEQRKSATEIAEFFHVSRQKATAVMGAVKRRRQARFQKRYNADNW